MPFDTPLLVLNLHKNSLGKLLLTGDKFDTDLESNWVVVAEAIQTILRREAILIPTKR